jgi:hypothetical protein
MTDPHEFAEKQRDERFVQAMQWFNSFPAPPPNVVGMTLELTYDDGCKLAVVAGTVEKTLDSDGRPAS